MYSFKEKKLHYNRLQNQSAALADLKLLRSINPVSYTHLTLPTIA